MMLYKEFLILRYLLKNNGVTQRNISKALNISVGTVNKYINDLLENNLINNDYTVRQKGINALEPYRVKRAIIMAAGFGSRMVPVTLTTPKPLVTVNGTRIIDTIIDALIEKGIEDITIVRGYLKHRFNELLTKYPNIEFIDNDLYNDTNNIYSVLLAKEKLENAYIIEGDFLIFNSRVIDNYHYCSNFLAFSTKKSDDWCFKTKNNIITSFVRGGTNIYQEVGISYWNKQDGRKLSKDIEKVYKAPGGKELLWENVPFLCCNQNYNIVIKKCNRNDIIEIDTFNELCDLDPSYTNYKQKRINIEKTIIRNICNTLSCSKDEISGIELLKIGLTNMSFKFNVNGVNYVYRKPGVNTNKYINRESEVYSEKIAQKLGLDNTVVYIDQSGWKISKYLENSMQINPYDYDDKKAAMMFIKKLHDAKIVSDYDFDYIKETERFIDLFTKEKTVDFSSYKEFHNIVAKINKKLERKGFKKVLCHNDFWFWNILKDDKGNLCLIDWEYSGNSYPASDVAYFVSSLNYSINDYLELAEIYEGQKLSNEKKWYYIAVLAIVMWYWHVWALYKESNGQTIEDKDMWYQKAIDSIDSLKRQDIGGI